METALRGKFISIGEVRRYMIQLVPKALWVVKNWKTVFLPATGFVIGFGFAWVIQDFRLILKEVDLQTKQTTITVLEKDLAECQKINQENQERFKILEKEIIKMDKLCAGRIKIHRQKEDRIRRIDEIPVIPLPPPRIPQENIEKDGGKDEKVYIVNSGDPLLDKLNRMFSDPPTNSEDRVYKTASAGDSGETTLLSCQVASSGYIQPVRLYCLDAENAKNLLKNREIDKAYQEELVLILGGMR